MHSRSGALRRRLAPVVPIAVVVVVALFAGCEPSAIELGFRPSPGDEFRYRSTVTADVTTVLEGEPTRTRRTSSVLEARVVVTEVTGELVRADVTIARPGAPSRTLTARFDRGEQLTAIDLIEGLSPAVYDLGELGVLGVSLVAPPTDPVVPGQTWEPPVHATPGASGVGRLDRLTVEEGDDVAIVVTDVSLPVQSLGRSATGRTRLDGSEHTRTRIGYDLADGSLRHVRAVTRGAADLLVEPPLGVVSDPVPGTISYVVRVTTRRLE